jgi:hypothetical protein
MQILFPFMTFKIKYYMIDAVVCEVRFLQVMHFECHTVFHTFLAFFPHMLKRNEGRLMRSDNKVCELAIVCLLWQQWTDTSVWFHEDGISALGRCENVEA